MADRQQKSTSQLQMQTSHRCEYIAPGRNSSSLKKTEWTLALWNIEGQRNVMNIIPETALQKYDIVILIETFATKSIEIAGKYSTHTLAIQGAAGRPSGGVSCYTSPTMGQKYFEHTEENTVILKTNIITIIIGLYFNPKADIVDVIDSTIHAIRFTNPEEVVILAGNFNRRLDTNNQRSRILIDTLEEEGFRLINKPDQKTYYANNGSSTIDLVFLKGNLRVLKQEVLMTSELSTIRKLLPVITRVETEQITNRKEIQQNTKVQRKINIQKFKESEQDIQSIKRAIRQNKITEATEKIEHILMAATRKRSQRKAKPWFDSACYN
ncbi:hypothetical protein C0J52_22292 [Blattella germanica]|nr:hypothetical protein C0J52_22292 [Blattella germanica]